MKTQLTMDMEEALYYYCLEQGDVVVEEVTMPDDQGIVDTLSCRFLPTGELEWRCYEIKVSKADFRSKAKLSFIGHYNYFLLPLALYDQIKEEIPEGIGIMIYRPFDGVVPQELLSPGMLTIVKSARRQALEVDNGLLTQRFMASQAREVRKAKMVEKGLALYSSEQLFQELKKREASDLAAVDGRFYQKFLAELEQQTVTDLRTELALLKVTQGLQQKSHRRRTEALE
ncbi:hypothetical protein I6N95_20290 [Vagococcus sp. BWB3-3]|uniref:Uncharacterized protein n=1 Tax=Vagococcus allomyrinae TaxID=2794353 RepID=A0A940SWJ9_9ENTE|nr:hypothetical protein [Vagococcus allomyrinae]MBP1043365.1 hypothetical protein [Vagococcus allomyrinae]